MAKRLVAYMTWEREAARLARPASWPVRIYIHVSGARRRCWDCSVCDTPSAGVCCHIHDLAMGNVVEDPQLHWRIPRYLVKLTAFGAAKLRHVWAALALDKEES